jgi:hypothetical protein
LPQDAALRSTLPRRATLPPVADAAVGKCLPLGHPVSPAILRRWLSAYRHHSSWNGPRSRIFVLGAWPKRVVAERRDGDLLSSLTEPCDAGSVLLRNGHRIGVCEDFLTGFVVATAACGAAQSALRSPAMARCWSVKTATARYGGLAAVERCRLPDAAVVVTADCQLAYRRGRGLPREFARLALRAATRRGFVMLGTKP